MLQLQTHSTSKVPAWLQQIVLVPQTIHNWKTLCATVKEYITEYLPPEKEQVRSLLLASLLQATPFPDLAALIELQKAMKPVVSASPSTPVRYNGHSCFEAAMTLLENVYISSHSHSGMMGKMQPQRNATLATRN